jgi:hypothetical protein
MTKRTPDNATLPAPPLGELLAMALRYAREQEGYNIVRIDRAIAQALLVEAMQRVAMLADTPLHQIPDREATIEIFDLVLADVRNEAMRLLMRSLH